MRARGQATSQAVPNYHAIAVLAKTKLTKPQKQIVANSMAKQGWAVHMAPAEATRETDDQRLKSVASATRANSRLPMTLAMTSTAKARPITICPSRCR